LTKVNDIFDAVFCINLDRRKDRWEEFMSLWEPLGVEIERVSAVDGSTLEIPKDTSFVYDQFHSAASVGCALSHCSVLEEAKKRGYSRILVLEDDATPCERFTEIFPLFYEQIPKDFNFCYLGGTNMSLLHGHAPEPVAENVILATDVKSTVAYAINLEFADTIIEEIRNNLYNLAVDEVYAKLQREHTFYIFHPRLIHQFESYSDIIEKDIYYHWMRDLK